MAIDSNLVDSLRRLGLNQYEAKAYAALSMFGSQTVGELSERASVPRPRGYDVLMSLQEKGFVSVQHGRPVCYTALPIGEAVRTLKKQRENSLVEELQKMEEIARELSGRLKSSTVPIPSEDRVWTLKGRDAIYSRMAAMIASAKKHLILAAHSEGLRRKLKIHGKELIKAKERGVRINIIAPQGEGEAIQLAHSVFEKEVPTRMLLTENEALLFLTDSKVKAEEESGLWLKSPHVVQTLKNALGVKV